jgi:hypothetical protein
MLIIGPELNTISTSIPGIFLCRLRFDYSPRLGLPIFQEVSGGSFASSPLIPFRGGSMPPTDASASAPFNEQIARLKPEEEHDTYLTMEAALRRSNLRLDVVRRYRGVKDTYGDKDTSL